jgi:hypothetical protein
MMFPVISFKGAATFKGASSIGRLPARPFDTPRAAVKMKAGSSPEIVGFFRGATQRRSRGIKRARSVDMRISCRRDQVYGTAARTFPITSQVLKVNIRRTGLELD